MADNKIVQEFIKTCGCDGICGGCLLAVDALSRTPFAQIRSLGAPALHGAMGELEVMVGNEKYKVVP